MSITVGKEKTFILVIRGLLGDLEGNFMKMYLFQHAFFSCLDVAMKHLNTTGQNMADLRDLNAWGLGIPLVKRCLPIYNIRFSV